jgi:hypothetical protein
MLLAQQGYNVLTSHSIDDFQNQKQTITIARNPVDSVASAFAMVSFYKKEIEYGLVELMLKNYEKTYTWLLNNYTHVILYEDLIEKPKEVIESFLNRFSLDKKDIVYNLNLSKDDPKEEYLVSSKGLDIYNEILEYTKTCLFINAATESYRKLLFSKWVDGN